ncbi:MAG: hypothetical protein ABDI07_09490 [Candidatus Kryptonium sp.]
MKVYKFVIKPKTAFGTPLVGDTLFGQLCWEFYYDPELLGNRLEDLIRDYKFRPFIIVSSAFPLISGKTYLKRPSLPLHFLFNLPEEELIRERKALRRKRWFLLETPLPPLSKITYVENVSNGRFLVEDEQVRCSIHRLYGTTVEAPYGPFVVEKLWYLTDLIVFIGLREDMRVNGIFEALVRIGKTGYGKDSSCGLGKFEVISYEEIDFYHEIKEFNAYYTLSPSLPDDKDYKAIYYEPVVRFGRHGNVRSYSKNPFKAPVLMADSGAIYVPAKAERRIYIGRAIYGTSAIDQDTVMQGYSLVIPVEVAHESKTSA